MRYHTILWIKATIITVNSTCSWRRPYLQFLEETKPHTGPTADQPSCIMSCRTTVGKYLLNLRAQLWPYGKHRSSCTIITSKQTAEESILTKWHLSKCYGFITVQPDHKLPWGSVWFKTKAAQSIRQLQMDIHRISLLLEQLWSPDWPLESQKGPSMLGHSVWLRPIYFNMGRKAANNNKRERERRKYSGLTGCSGIEKTVASGGQRLGSGSDVKCD